MLPSLECARHPRFPTSPFAVAHNRLGEMAEARISRFVALLSALALAAALGAAAGRPALRDIAIAGAVAVVLIELTLEAPVWALLAFLVIRPVIDAYVYTSVAGLTLGQVWGIGLLGAIAIYFASRPRATFPASPAALLIVYMGMTLVRPSTSVAVDSALKLASWLLLAVAMEHVASERRGQQAIVNAMWASAWCLVVVIALAVVEGRYGAAYYGITTTAAGYARPHALASVAVLVIPFALMSIIAGRWVRLSVVAASLLTLGVVASLVRTAYIALIVVMVAYLIAALRLRAARARVSVLVIVGALVVAGARYQDEIIARLSDLPLMHRLVGGAPLVAGGGSGRVKFEGYLLQRGTDSLSHVLFGRGAGASVQLLSRYYGDAIWSHNDFLEFFISGGVILLFAYLALLVWLFASFTRLYRDSRQSSEAHACAIVLLGAFFGFIVLSAANGIALTAWATGMAVLVGLARGMMKTPGDTILDPPAKADQASIPELDDVRG